MKQKNRPATKVNLAVFDDNMKDLKAEARQSEEHQGQYTSLLNKILDERYAHKRKDKPNENGPDSPPPAV